MTEKIKQKLREIEDSLELIEEGLPSTEEEFRRLKLAKDGIYKRLEFCIQNILDICSVIYSAHKLGVPSTLDDILDGLEREKIFRKETMSLIRQMKGLRNILIHKYGKIDDGLVYELLTERLEDIQKVIVAVDKYLRK